MEQLDFNKILQDTQAFEDVSLSPYNPMDINEPCIDFDELHQLLYEDNSGEGAEVIGVNNAITNNNNNNNNNNNGETSIGSNKVMVEANVNKRRGRPRFKRGTVEAAQMKELHRIRNRETASRALEKKKAYVEGLERQVHEFRRENAILKNLIMFMESSMTSNMTQKQLMRTASGSLYVEAKSYIDC